MKYGNIILLGASSGIGLATAEYLMENVKNSLQSQDDHHLTEIGLKQI